MIDILADLPDDVRDAIAPHTAPPPGMLEAISIAIASKRDEAKAARTSSGIESVWLECEEAYVGIDDANRGDFHDAKWSKPMSMDGPVTTGKVARNDEYKSTAFVRLTARYVDAGAAKLSEILLPADDKAFSLTETPIPALIKAKGDTSQVMHDGMGNAPLTRPAKPGELPPQAQVSEPGVVPSPVSAPVLAPGAVPAAGAGGGQPMVPLTVKDLAEENIEIARKKAKAAERRIYDWMVECQYTAEMRKVVFDGARIGTGVVKAPYPKSSRSVVTKKGDDGTIGIEIEERITPAAKWVDPWNIFPDPACGESFRDGDYIFERDYLSERQVRELKKIPGYITSQIDRVIEEGPSKTGRDDAGSKTGPKAKSRYEVWYFYGQIAAREMECICAAADRPYREKEKKPVHAIVTLINSCVVRATVNPLDSGDFPYHHFPWQRRAGNWAGIGVAEQVKMPQQTINAATRAMLNNAGKSAGSQIVINQGSIHPADGSPRMTPDKVWYKTGDSIGDDVRKDFMAITIPNVTDQLMKIIQYALQLAEESTSIPLITQGQSGPTTPDTFGAAQLQNNNANQLLRSIGYAFDDYITEPIVRQFYEWLLLDQEIPDEEKGDFSINAHGSIALVERAIQDQTISQMAALSLNPAYGFDPKKWATMFLKSKRIDPKEVQYTEEEQAKIAAVPPPPPPAVQVATIRAEVDRAKIVSEQQASQQTVANEMKIAESAQALAGKRIDVDHQKTATSATLKLHEMQERRELAMLEYANRHQVSLDQAKTELAKTAMTLDVQRELSGVRDAQVAPAAAEPEGRAPNGEGFEK